MGYNVRTQYVEHSQRQKIQLIVYYFRYIATSVSLTLMLHMGHAAQANDELVVVASIKPVHSIVSAIMEGVGEPHLIMKGTSSPHTFNLRPSDARALDRSDVVFQIGQAMEASLADIMWTLAARAEIVSLSHATKLVKLSYREGGVFEPHDHDHGHSSHTVGGVPTPSNTNDARHDADHGHDDEEVHEDASIHEHLLEDEVDETFDMHIWLDPENGRVIAEVVASVLANHDAENSDTYAINLKKFLAKMDALESELQGDLEALDDRPFIAFHDAYRYFEDRFNLLAVGSAVVVPGRSAGARRIQELRQKINELNVVCVFSEPQFDEQLILTIVEDTNAKVGVLDPLGSSLEDGTTLYPALLRDMGDSFRDCLKPVT
ncbi:MAG: zinc ABC transporter substrate-binding protein [Gammaproteobacteria bacterium]|nr:zinc ABC transporter substrate-binding protein [Gammaproteobacteria bacterium]